jgi:TfoX/Sxy family transcriptional regulator of competence genes
MEPEDDIAARVREALKGAGTIREVRMFGGIGFMLNDNMVAAVSKRGLLLRVGKDKESAMLAWGARPMVMGGRRMTGYVYVDPPLTDRGIEEGLPVALAYVRALPPKAAAGKARRGRKT